MKFFAAILLVALVACSCSASEEASVRKLEPVADKQVEPAAEQVGEAQARGKRGFVVGAYTAPVAAAVAAPAYTAAYTAPVAYTYGSLPYAYSPYASYYGYPAVYV